MTGKQTLFVIALYSTKLVVIAHKQLINGETDKPNPEQLLVVLFVVFLPPMTCN